MKTKIEVDCEPYECAHGRHPHGYGSWAFHPDENVDSSSPDIIWVNQATFTEARKRAKLIARSRGWVSLVVLT